MDRIIRTITTDGSIMAAAVDSSDLVYMAQKLHGTSPVATAALGRLLTGASIMGTMLKKEDAAVTLKINGGGPLGSVVAIGDGRGNVRGYVENPTLDLPLAPNGKLAVGAAVGRDGRLSVVRDLGEGEPYVGQVEIISGEIAEDITNYYATSEQIPTVCALGVLVNKDTGKAMLAGGLLIQLLPGATNEVLTRLEANIAKLEPVTTVLAKGMDSEAMARKALEGFEVEVLDSYPVHYRCTCSKDRVQAAIATLQPEEVEHLADERGVMEAHCQYCNRTYTFTRSELEELAADIRRQKAENN
ncbi:MAG: Hsp33 family molecular chaperone HslO [Clostridia bacterium]|nr:Hsp33 family molecular chaperone HslO [Clostridia bacterium]